MAKLVEILASKGNEQAQDWLDQAERKRHNREVRGAKYRRDLAICALLKARRQHKAVAEVKATLGECVAEVRSLTQ